MGVYTYEICLSCVGHLNGSDDATEEEANAAKQGMWIIEENLKEGGYTSIFWVEGTEDTGLFFWNPCQLCRLPLAGSRHTITVHATAQQPQNLMEF